MNPGPGLAAARIEFAADGTPRAVDFDDVYHSANGGLGQARHVFLGGNELPQRWAGRSRFAILETGFGLGINFLATWLAWRNDPQRPAQLHYFAVEKYPVATADLRRALAGDAELAPLAEALAAAWPPPLAGFHRLHFEGGRLSLTLLLGDARQLLTRVEGRFDAFYLDGFSPERNPELWSPALLAEIAWLAAPDARCATYTVARSVRDGLAEAGFDCVKRPGFATKRDMLVGRITPGAASPAPSFTTAPTHVAVIGAGIAGVTVAERLARRGVRVTLLEANAAPAQGATGNRLAAMLPVLALEEIRLSRLNRAAFLYALHRLHSLDGEGHAPHWSPCGVLQLPRSAELARRQARIIDEQALPPAFASLLSAEAAAALVGAPVAGFDGSAGWWFPQGGWVNPTDLCRALLASAGAGIELRCHAAVSELRRDGDAWQIIGSDGKPLLRATDVVLANSHGLLQLEQARHLPLLCFRGQVSHLPATTAEPPRCVVSGNGYLTPAVDGRRCLGASFESGSNRELRLADHQSNLARLRGMLPTASVDFDAARLDGRVGLRPVSPDKLPMLGALPLPHAEAFPAAHAEWPRWPGLYLATGYGARGLVWAHLMAELLACQLLGEPQPLEGELVAAVDPARFVWKAAKV